MELSSHFKGVIRSLPVHNVFNPSFYWNEKVKLFAFRAIPNGDHELLSFLSIEDEKGHSITNISAELQKLGVARLVDPKIVKLHDEFYITFHSGWLPGGNDIFLLKIYPEIGSPRRILYSNRQEQERNWAFFSDHGDTYALYRMNPLKILKLTSTTSSTWKMEDHYSAKERDKAFPADFSIGTQLSQSADRHYFAGHYKLLFRRKKIYLGKIFAFHFQEKRIVPSKGWLVHSLRSLMGSEIKHNTNLFSCTYFSGLQAAEDFLILGYGVNDVESGFARLRINALTWMG